MGKVQAISAVMIFANDPESLAGWYSDCLGIPTYRDDRDGNYYGEVRDPETDAAIQIGIYPAPEQINGHSRPMMVNYRVGDLDELVSDLTAAGVEIERRSENSYGRFAYIRDPEGNPIELWSEPAYAA